MRLWADLHCTKTVGYFFVLDFYFPSYSHISLLHHTEVTAQDDIVYFEAVCEGVRKLEAYVEEMATGDLTPTAVNIEKVKTCSNSGRS